MAIQQGPNYFTGTIGDQVYYKRNGVYCVRRKRGPTKAQIKNSPNYAKTREHNAEIAAFGKGVKVIRKAFSKQYAGAADQDMTARLGKKAWEVVKSDKHDHGNRCIMNGDVTLLNHFEFNKNTDLRNILKTPFTSAMDRKTGRMTLHVPSFNPANELQSPAGATHFRLISCVAEIQFDIEESVKAASEGEYIALDSPSVPAITFTSFLHHTSMPLFMSLGIQFFQEVNGKMYQLNDSAYSAVSLVQVEGMVATVHTRPATRTDQRTKQSEQMAERFSKEASEYLSHKKRRPK